MAARIVELENELLALELTALRVVANSADGKPHPASSVLKLRGSELQQAATELMVDIAGPLSLASFADEGSDVPDWARVGDAELPELPQGLHLRRLQRDAAHHHRRLDPGVVRQTVDFNSTASRTTSARPCAACWPAPTPTASSAARSSRPSPGFDEKTWARLAEMGVLGLPFAEEDGGMGAGPVEVAIVAEEIGRVLAPEPFIEAVVLAGGLVAAVGTAEQRGEILGRHLRGDDDRRASRTPSPAPAGARRPRASPPRRAATAGR